MYKNIYTTLFPFLKTREEEFAPQAESDTTLAAQTNSALNESSPRSGVLITPGENVPPGANAMMPVQTNDGTLFVNQQKTGFENPQAAQDFVAQNGVAPILAKAENIPNNSESEYALRTQDPQGMELATSAITNAQSAAQQAALDQESFGNNVTQTIVPSNEVAATREDENIGGLAEQYPTILEADNTEAPEFLNPANSFFSREEGTGQGVGVPNTNLGGGRAPYIVNKSNKFETPQGGLDYWQKVYENPQNEDRGVRGFLKELAENFLYSMSQARGNGEDGLDWKTVLASGGAGAGFGALNRSWNEERRAANEIPYWQQRVGQQQQQQKFESDQATEAERRKLLQAQQGNIATDNADAATRLKQRDIAEFWKETARYGYDPTSPTGVSPTQKALIEKYPELANMPKRRASNAKLIEINGVRLEQQPDGSYREAGLPMEKRNQEELFEVTDANGNKFSYWMTSQAAGKTRADLIKEGYKIEAANADKQETIEQQNRKGKQDYDQDLLTQQETINKSSRQIEANNLRIAGLEKEIAQKSVSNLPISKVDKDGNETQTGGVIDTTALSNQVTALKAENIVLQGNITNANTRLDYLQKNPFVPKPFTPTQTISGQTVQTGGGNTGNKVPIEKDPLKIFQ